MRKFFMTVSSETRRIREVSSKIIDMLSQHKVEEDRLYDIKLCTEEAVRNAMVHGNHSNKNKTVRVAYWMDDDMLNIEIEDEGGGYDYRNIPDPTKNANIRKGSGRGVHLIKKLMDDVRFNDRGNMIGMRKKLK